MPSHHRLKRRVQFYETDAAGIVHFSWFYRYMEEAEHALWRKVGLSISPRDAKIGFPRVSATFDFHHPLHFEDEFEITITVVKITTKTIQYRAVITCQQRDIATGSMIVACVSKTPGQPMKSITIPREIADRFQPSD